MNKVILAGRLVRDPELRYTQTGKAVASFTLAVNRRFSHNNEQQTADFIPIIVWDKLAEVCSKHLFKGSQVLIEGRMQVRNYVKVVCKFATTRLKMEVNVTLQKL